MLYKLLPLGTWFNTANTLCLLHCSLWKIQRLKTTRRCIWIVSVRWVQGVLLPPVMTQPRGRKTQYWNSHNISPCEELRTHKSRGWKFRSCTVCGRNMSFCYLVQLWKAAVRMFCWKFSCDYSVVSVPTPLCLTCVNTHSTCRKRDRSENMLSTIARAGHQIASPDGGKSAVVKNYLLSLQNDLYQDLQMLFSYFTNMCQPRYVSPESDGQWSSSEELLQRELTWWT